MTVFLVGAGPGDPGLLTVRARELIDSADVILYDRLIPPGILDGVQAELVYVGKQGGGPQMPQEEIDRLLVQYGSGGRSVVRLKGGDPFVFGRGGEEALVLRQAGIPFEVVPGITAGIAAPAYAGVPVTHRELASGVAFVTGHENPSKPETALDWPALAAFPGTLVFYMGVKALPRIASQLIAGGRAADEPVAVVEQGTLPGQKTVLSTLAEIGSVEGIRAPAITLVGPVAALREQLAWLETRPLYGRTVAVTRARAQASALAARLRALGASVVEAPAIRTQALDVTVPDVRGYDLLCVTSPTGADQLFTHLRDARDLAGVTVAAIGPGTARALHAHGIDADIVPQRAVAEGLVEALDAHAAAAATLRATPASSGAPAFQRVLVARAAEGRDVLIDALRERGSEVDVVALYETVPEPLDDDARAAAAAADYVLFTSASSARFFAAAGGSLDGPRLVSIGPATSAELRGLGWEPDLEADPHTPDGLIAALLADAVTSAA
ncbi:uroporphyrinogen-III C-methyltransferase [Solirubrobacter ginsenosidimutans]|uniref:uroporphyrinogen-III C-methyltransferase n=1 Tax=Solirubrobacter ginsenosidimutans TaxID=490573 RepID=A0A9X3N0L2_9ACTN|nr:uroporphyrinogen-III C-methyltransferase [Solirubrobacter ginsenosidimutans]MDA0166224.1 uroporphyrinogen-III C-methyltransferase [Solirubrobacter ginsenosidimutans]